ncbi:MAG: FGGY-family carbohydrate kinase, partial [Chloroflexota bacterium]
GHRLSAAYSLSKILWIKDNQPKIFASTHKFMCAKDAMIARLTGAFVTEPSDASGTNAYNLEAGNWSEEILHAAGLDRTLLPDVKRSIDVAGEITPTASEEVGLPVGTHVVLGGGDGACAAIGAGSIKKGMAYSYVGSSAWVATASATPILDPEQRTFTFGHIVPGLYMPTGTMQTAGAAYQWMRDQLSPLEKQSAEALGISPYVLMNAIAEGSPAGSNNLLFLPYLAGERSPRWNPNARAAFIGLTMRHTRADMIRAVMEGVALNLAVVVEAFHNQGETFDSIRAIGGGISGRVWAGIMADIYNVPMERLNIPEQATSMGAAVTGGVGVGLYPDFSIALKMNAISDTIDPNPANRGIYEKAYQAFEASYTALEPIFDLLADE